MESSAALQEEVSNDESIQPLQTVLVEKFIGSSDAPVTIIELSSLSCGHCGSFHTDVYPELKKNYIETGKVKLIMVDFPLNLPALQGAMLAHCLPDDQYFGFLQLLFSSQSSWLSGDTEAKLKQNALLAGLSEEQVATCLADKSLEEALLSRMQTYQADWDISSTPSFIINGGAEKIVGNRPYSEFKAIIDKLIGGEETSKE
jgi:protein-disulfide isomerase